MNLRCLLVLALAGTCGAVPSGRAAEPLRLEEAVARALAANPLLVAEAAELRAIRARAQREGMPPQYVVSGDFDNVAGTGTLSGGESAEATPTRWVTTRSSQSLAVSSSSRLAMKSR